MEIIVEEKLNKRVNAILGKDVNIIKCSNCNKELIFSTQRKYGRDWQYNIQVKCGFCGDKSFIYEVFGQVSLLPCEEVQIIDVQQDDKNNLVTFITRSKEKK